ncbi:bactofilin family protein [Maricaulis sp.]|uniref:bactofilin family protein n=1 Tax=Maricaulis sp. TaxID=1486257 RepID=UPI003A8DD248|tara:strand:- start:1581 stop:2036 length:456 start_codon:yes stop_codon:yes gene_type:complete
MKSRAPSILSGDLVLTGSIVSEGEVQLDGSVDGDIRAGSLIIGEDAVVNGEVYAETVVIRGKVSGSVRARQVQLAATARIEGDIVHAALSVESGAFFDGHCRHSTDPLAEKSGPTATTTSAPKVDNRPPAPPANKPASVDQPPLAANKSSL